VTGARSPERRALVTGASGFIGSKLCRRLVERGMEVHATSRSRRPDDDVRWHQVDLTHHEAVERLVRRVSPQVVYHLASHVTGSSELSEVRATFEGNLASVVTLLAAVAGRGCQRVVMAGSDKELGIRDGEPGSPYAASKLAASAYGRMFHGVYGLSVVNLRIFMVYGPGQADTTKLVPYTISSLLAGVSPRLSSGTRMFDWIYVEDVVDALLAAADVTSGDDGESIDVGSGELVSIRQLVDRIAREVGGVVSADFGAVPDRSPEPGFAANLERARACLAWTPTTSLASGVAQTVASYRMLMRDGATGFRLP
jgi:UDP-glucose 4-epimerase